MATVAQYAACFNDSVTADEASVDSIPGCNALTVAGITARLVGRVTSGAELVLRTEQGLEALPSFDRDELARFLEDRGAGC